VAALKTLLFTVFVPGTVAGLVPYLLTRGDAGGTVPLGATHWLGLLPILAGLVIYLRSAWDFVAAGRGTPAPIDPPKRLVARGFYRFSRNPMYVAVLAVLLGEAIVLGSATLAAYALAVGIAFHLFVVLYEEPTLRRLYGRAYEEYCNEVPRWFPLLRRPRAPTTPAGPLA
jgi:protein-S-isoprenylcysteine O-methyltransferase Ste14